MGNLLNTLHSVADSMIAYQKALQVTGNNVTNANTPGYVRQRLNIESRPLEIQIGLTGGVMANSLISSRRAYLERAVHEEAQREGRHSQFAFSVEQVEPVFDIAQASGIAGAMDTLFRTFSQWAVSPNDVPAREAVLRSADAVADSFNFTSASLGNAQRNAEVELRGVVDGINRIGQQLKQLNNELRNDARRLNDPGLDAQIHSALEELSEYTDFTLLRGDDGSFNVYVGGQTPLVIGDKFYEISTAFSDAGATIYDFMGKDVTGQFQQGRVRGLLDLRNDFLPSVLADVDRLAETFADRINAQLVAGVNANGQPPAETLFTYAAGAGAAGSLMITGITTEDLAAASPDAPGGNANALALAGLGSVAQIDNFSFTQYFGQIASRVGRALSAARDDQETHAMLLSQARSIRAQTSEVSLDEEAANLIAFQRGFEASAQLVRVLDELTETVMNMMR
jgi:flagellar hook-associated protein 1 FlgK